MKKVTFQNSKGYTLHGALHTPKEKTDRAVILSHGSTSNKDRERLVKLADSLAESGIATLRFDFGGSGENEDRDILVGEQVDDLKSAILYIREKGFEKVGLLGESLGALITILSYDNEIMSLALLAPVTGPKASDLVLNREIKKELNEKGFLMHRKDNRDFRIPKKYFEERWNVNQEDILSKIKVPVLIIQSDDDDTIPLEQSQKALDYLPKSSKLEVLSGGGHRMDSKMEEVIGLTDEWFRKYL